jgi:small-conductance mechanosensitive channel
LFFGLIAALAAAGYQVGQLALIFGALSVGIGFGLQDIVKNLIAGIVLMVERPIQPGDIVEVAGMTGTVREIRMRATVVGTFDGADVVVPNGVLFADKLVNWTLTRNSRRIEISVSTGFGTSPQETIDLLVGIAARTPGIASGPPPAALLTGLASGTLEFLLRAWTEELADWVAVRSALAVQVRDGLAAAGIEVPLPQRDLHLRTGFARPVSSSE